MTDPVTTSAAGRWRSRLRRWNDAVRTGGLSLREQKNAHGGYGHQGCTDAEITGPCDCLCHRDEVS